MPAGPALPVIVAAGLVQVVRQNAMDVAVFFGTALLIVVDAQLPHTSRSRRIPTGFGWVVLAALLGAVLGLAGLGSPVTRIVLAMAGVVGLVVTLRGPADRTVAPLPPGWRAWASVAVAVAVWELLAWLSQDQPDLGNPDHPTLSTLADPVLASTLGRSLLCGAWAAGMVWLLRELATGGDPNRRSGTGLGSGPTVPPPDPPLPG